MVVQDSVSNNPNRLESFEWWLIFVESFGLVVRTALVNARPCVFEQSLPSCQPKNTFTTAWLQMQSDAISWNLAYKLEQGRNEMEKANSGLITNAIGYNQLKLSSLSTEVSSQPTGARSQPAGERLQPAGESWKLLDSKFNPMQSAGAVSLINWSKLATNWSKIATSWRNNRTCRHLMIRHFWHLCLIPALNKSQFPFPSLQVYSRPLMIVRRKKPLHPSQLK